jgi:hypothetical protein
MPTHSLHEIEKTMRMLWMDRKEREAFLDGQTGKKKKAAASRVSEVSPELLGEIDKNGVKLYAGLLNYGHQDLMLSIYPGCAKLIGDKWEDVVDHYLEKYPPEHFNLNRTASRFPEYIGKYGDRYLKRFPYLAELADYEWIELELMESDVAIEVCEFTSLTTPEHFEQWAPVVNQVLLLREYKYPITNVVDHLEDDCCLPRDVEPAQTFVAVYRDPETNFCRFLEVGQSAAKVISTAQAARVPYRDLLGLAVSMSAAQDPQQAVVEFLELIEKLQSLSLFVGSVRI